MDAIIPAAGSASRMRGIPKFLLPCDSQYTTLIERHLSAILDICETVWIPIRPDLVSLLTSLGLQSDRVVLLPVTTQNMTQSVLSVLRLATADEFMMVMPDTYFLGEQPYPALNSIDGLVRLALWEIREDQRGRLGQVLLDGDRVLAMRDKEPNCDFRHAWGAMAFAKNLRNHMVTTDPHIGFAVQRAVEEAVPVEARMMAGSYFDCGTPLEYLEMLSQVYR